MHRLLCALLAVGLVGLLLPLAAHAHSGTPTAASASAAVETPAASVSSAAPSPPPVALLCALGAGVLIAAAGGRPRRALGLALVALLTVFAAEAAIHSVHHLGDHAGTTCAVAATAGQLTAALDDVAPVVPAPPPTSAAVFDGGGSLRAATRHGPDPARAPPAPLA